jgi:hypothetical protein
LYQWLGCISWGKQAGIAAHLNRALQKDHRLGLTNKAMQSDAPKARFAAEPAFYGAFLGAFYGMSLAIADLLSGYRERLNPVVQTARHVIDARRARFARPGFFCSAGSS